MESPVDPFTVFAAVVGGFFLYLGVQKLRSQIKLAKMTIPMVRGGLPILGQALTMLKNPPWDTMTKWVAEYGPLYQFKLFGRRCVVVADPDILREVLQTKMNSFSKDKEFTYRPFMSLLGTGLVTSEGKLWRQQRTLVSSALRFDILQEIQTLAKEATERLALKLDKVCNTGKPIEIAEEFRHLTLQVICEAICSLSPEETDMTLANMYLPIVEEGNLRTWYPHREYLPTPAWFRHFLHVRRLNNYLSSIIEKRWALRQQEKGNRNDRKTDLLDKVMDSVQEGSWGMDMIRQLRDEIKTFILAGHETSASMLTWALYELTQNPQQLEKVVEEAKTVYGHSNRPEAQLPVDKLGDLVYSECCLKESLRKYSVVPVVVRNILEDVTLHDQYIPKEATVFIMIQGVHHRPDLWESPEVYQPERFLQPPKPYTFLPFIDGPRQCLGQNLALLESKVVLSTLIQRYQFTSIGPNAGKKHPFMVPIIPLAGLQVLVARLDI